MGSLRDLSALNLHTVIEPFGPAGALILSDDQVSQLGGGKRAAVLVRIGERSARVRLAVMGGCNVIGLSKANRALLGVEIGQTVDAEVSRDDAARSVSVPNDLQEALASEPDLRTTFDSLAFTHRREYVEWVDAAKKPETRARRIAATLERLRDRAAPG